MEAGKPTDAVGRSSARYCCTTGGSLAFWLGVFAVVWGLVLLVRAWVPALGPYTPALLAASAGVACLANFARNRTFHCAITGPFFLLVAFALALGTAGVWSVPLSLVWPLVLIVIGVSLLLERRFAS